MTLIEIMLVMSLMVVLSAVVMIGFNNTFSYRSLIAGGDALRGEISTVRNLAMQTGTIRVMTLTPQSDRIVTTLMDSSSSMALMDSVAADTADAADKDGDYRVAQLPEKVTFMGGVMAMDTRDLFVQQGEGGSSKSGGGGAVTKGKTAQIYFYPDGATSDAALYLKDESGNVILVTLRGLTGMSTIREVDPSQL